MLRCRTGAATTASRPGWPAANGGTSWALIDGTASRATAESISWTVFRSAPRGAFGAERKGTLARHAARCPAKFPAQRAALDAVDSGATQPYASAGEYAPADYDARS